MAGMGDVGRKIAAALWMTEVMVIPTTVNAKLARILIAFIRRGG